jgi:hypothetical protein
VRAGWIRTFILVSCFAGAASAGYWVSANLGSTALRLEAQRQLAKLLKGDVQVGRTRIVIRGGLILEGERVGAYPRDTVPHVPALFASHVTAEIDVFALLTGRFRLTSLVLDDVIFRMERKADGTWSPPPIQWLEDRRKPSQPDDHEPKLSFVRATEAAARFLLDRPVIARRLEVRRGRVDFKDAQQPDAEGRPLKLGLRAFEGKLVHHWLSGDADLEINTVMIGRAPSVVPLRAEGYKRRDEEVHVSVTAEGLPLALLERYTIRKGVEPVIGGTVSGEISYDTRQRDHGTMKLRSMVEDLSTAIPLKEGPLPIEQSLLSVDASVEVHPGRMRLVGGRMEAGGVVVNLDGSMERPLRSASRASFETSVTGLALPEVRSIAESLPGQNARTLENLILRFESGQIDAVGGRGSAQIATWGRLLRREMDALPADFVLSADLSGIKIATGGRGWIKDLGGRVELEGDHLRLHETRAFWNTQPLPALQLSLEGVSNLFRSSEPRRQLSASADSLPGIDPLWQIVTGGGQIGDEEPDAPPPSLIRLKIDALDHPALRWPIRDARVLIQPGSEGVAIEIKSARWAGAPIRGAALWFPASSRALTLNLEVDPPDLEPTGVDSDAPEAEAAAIDTTSSVEGADRPEWAIGRFEVDAIDAAPLPLRMVHGDFAVRGSELRLSKIRANAVPSGKLVANIGFQLDDPEKVATDANFSLVAADVHSVGTALGMPTGFAEGKVHFTGALDGPLMPQTPVLSNMQGEITMDARNGEVYGKLPLVAAIAQASEGFNSYSQRNALVYEYVKADLQIDHGVVASDDFRLEGPLRVYANGQLDTVPDTPELDGMVGVFIFRGAGDLMVNVPLVKAILPGSERGLVGAYYKVSGPVTEPRVVAMTGKSITEDLPDLLSTPLKVLRAIVGDVTEEQRAAEREAAEKAASEARRRTQQPRRTPPKSPSGSTGQPDPEAGAPPAP